MHKINPVPIMHQDIRWPNVIWYQNEYFLIDFEYATFSPKNEPLEYFTIDEHAPEILNGRHDIKVDIWVLVT